MSKAQKFEDLTIFQKTRELCKEVYAVTKEGEFSIRMLGLFNRFMLQQVR